MASKAESSATLIETAPQVKAGLLQQAIAIAGKDLRSEWRTKESINASLAFSIVILLLFSFAFDPSPELSREISGGLLWMVFAFASALILNRSFARELVNDIHRFLDETLRVGDMLREALLADAGLYLEGGQLDIDSREGLDDLIMELAADLLSLLLLGRQYLMRKVP